MSDIFSDLTELNQKSITEIYLGSLIIFRNLITYI